MKYIKLFEEFKGTRDNSLDLIEALGRYQKLIEDGMGYGDSREYFDILSRISEHMVKYREIFEYVLRTRFDSESDRLYTIVRDLNSLLLDLESESLSDQSRDIIREISDVLHKYSRMIEGVIDIHNYYSRSGDMESMSRGMREESEMLEGIMVSHQRVERMWVELLMSFDSVEKFEKKRELLGAIMNLMVDIEDGDGLEAKFEELSKKVLSILGDIIEALNTNVLGKRNGDGEIGRISQYYEELKSSERLLLEAIAGLSHYLRRAPKVEAPKEESSEEVISESMKYIKLSENFEEHDPYELMITPPNKKGEMIIDELRKNESSVEVVRNLIELGANLDWQDNGGRTALYWCSANNRQEIAKMLIDAGADMNIQNEDGWTALHWSAYTNRPEIVRMLIGAGADVNIQNGKGSTPLHLCAYESDLEIANMLIGAGADVNVQNSVGSTALHISAYENDLEFSKLLLDAGADKTIQNNVGLPYKLADTKELKELLKP